MKNKRSEDKNNFTDFNLIDTKEITSVLGIKRLNNNDTYFEYIVEDIIKRRNLPSIFFVSTKQESLSIYLKAKKMKRRILYISPSMIPFKNINLKDNAYYIEEYLNYKSCVLNNYVVIVDVEYMIDKDKSQAFILNILNIIEKTLDKMDNTAFDENIIIFDDSYLYATYIRDLLYRSKIYNTGLIFMIKQLNGAFDEFELRCLFDESIDKVLLPSIYLKDANEILEPYDTEYNGKVYFVKNNDLNIIDKLDLNNVNFDGFESASDKAYKSMLKVFNNKILKFEKSIPKNSEIINCNNDLKHYDKLNCESSMGNDTNNKSLSANIIQSNKSEIANVNRDDNKKNIPNSSNEPSVEYVNNDKGSSLAEKLKITLQGYNSNREELELSFDDDDFIE